MPCKRFYTSAIVAALVLLAGQAQAQVVNYTLDADNDMALYVGNADASIFRLVVDKTTPWMESISGNFTLNPGEEYFYMLSLNYGGPGDIGGFLNDVSLVDMTNWYMKDVTGQITGFPSDEDPTFTPDTENVRSLITSGGFSSASLSVGYGTCSPILGTLTFVTPTGQTATVYRQGVAAAGIAAAPEPGTLAFALSAGVPVLGMIRHRRRK